MRSHLLSLGEFHKVRADEEVCGDDEEEAEPAIESEALHGFLGVARDFLEPFDDGSHDGFGAGTVSVVPEVS